MSGNPYTGPGYSDRNRRANDGGPQGVQRSYASQLKEHEPLFKTYEHLQGLQRGDAALTMLRKVASIVKPIMRKRGWRVNILAEFLPPEQNLLGLNINKGYKICIRLRYHNNPDLFLPIEQVVDTMLHELSHIVWGEHDSNFHRLWDELRDEHEVLTRKGYTGEGFLSQGRRLGGSHSTVPPPQELRRLARASAEKRKAQGALSQGSGQRLGGTPLHQYGADVRQVIADQVARRNQINQGCASGRKDATKLSDQSSQNTFKTKAEEDDANDRAIAQALFELMEQEESQKLQISSRGGNDQAGLAWSPEHGLYDASMGMTPPINQSNNPTEEEQMEWALRESMNSEPGANSLGLLGTTNTLTSASPPPVPFASKPNQLPAPIGPPVSHPTQNDSSTVHEGRKRPLSPPPADQAIYSPATTAEEDLIDLSDDTKIGQTAGVQWACEVCTCINPEQFLACDACGVERRQSLHSKPKTRQQTQPKPKLKSTLAGERWKTEPRAQPESLGWSCKNCGAFMEHKWWTCSACGIMKDTS